jgi:hypothetical protein
MRLRKGPTQRLSEVCLSGASGRRLGDVTKLEERARLNKAAKSAIAVIKSNVKKHAKG